jgi:hypothetical protein
VHDAAWTETDEQARPRREWAVVRGRHAPPGRLHLQVVPRLAQVHTRVRQQEEERAQGIAPGMVCLGLPQVLKAAPLKIIGSPG